MKVKSKNRFMSAIIAMVLALSLIFAGCSKNEDVTKKTDTSVEKKDEEKNTVEDKVEDNKVETPTWVSDENLNPLGELPLCKEKVTLKVLIAQSANVDDYEENSFTKKIEEYGNVDLQFEVVPGTDYSTKLNLMMNSGTDLPDIIISGLSATTVSKYGAEGMLIPLNEYYENSSYYIKNALKREELKDKNLLSYITAPDGNIYTVLNYNETLQNEFTHVLWIYKPWLDELGLDVPETLEEYKNALQAFKDNDMNHNGEADEIPFLDYTNDNASSGVHAILNTFLTFEHYMDMLSVKDGTLRYAFTTDEWKQGMKYVADLCKNGLISTATFTIDQAQWKAILADEVNKVGSFVNTSPSCLPAGSTRRSEFVPVVLKGENNCASRIYRPSLPTYSFAITKDCENPEVAFRVGDLLCSDELTIWSNWGEKGVDWVEPGPDDHASYEFLGYKATIKPILSAGSAHSAHWGVALGIRTYDVAAGVVSATDVTRTVKAEAVGMLIDYIPDETVGTLIYADNEAEEYSEIFTDAKLYYREMTTKFITGFEDIDANWDNYINELENNINLNRALEIAQNAYNRTHGK